MKKIILLVSVVLFGCVGYAQAQTSEKKLSRQERNRAELCTLPHHSPYSGRGRKGIPAAHRPQLYPAQVGVRSGPEPLRLQDGGRHPGGGTARRQHRPAERYGPHLLALRARRPACALPDVYRRRRDHRSQQARTLAYRRTITQNTRKHLRVFFWYYRYATVADKGFLEPWFASGPAPSAA